MTRVRRGLKFKTGAGLHGEQGAKIGLRNQPAGRKAAVVRVPSFRRDRLKSFPESVSYASDARVGGLLGGRLNIYNHEYEHPR